MAKITRVFQQLFGQSGLTTYFGQFGSKAAGFPINSKDPATIQALAAFIQNGWPDAINSSNKAPFLEEMNALHFLLFYQLCNLFQDGIPAWDPSTTYYTGSIVRKDGTGELYSSAINVNVGQTLPSQSNNGAWNYVNTTSTVPPGAISDFAGPTIPSGWLNCDGTSYPTSTYPALFAAIGYQWGGSGANFSVPDLRGRTTIGVGHGPGLSDRTLATLLGEEAHILAVSEIPAGLTVTDPGHNHLQLPHGHSIADPGHIHLEEYGSGTASTGNHVTGANDAHSVPTSSTIATASAVTGITVANNTASNQSAATGISVGGGGLGHNNMQPSAAVIKMIKI